MPNEFLTALETAPHDTGSWVIKTLREFCEGIEEYIGGAVDCNLIPGSNETSLGPETKIVLSYYPMGLFQTLLRAYIPSEAQSLHLDLMDGNGPVFVENEDNLRSKLKTFLNIPTVANTLASLRKHSRETRRG
ncbi:MAG: hypothetical protein NTX50_14485 [Candidatus Sumerlaeota bacterium]|nr:hypothetical protein [Candidatus Sumerlaeota bacterium]